MLLSKKTPPGRDPGGDTSSSSQDSGVFYGNTQVSWWDVHDHVQPLLAAVGHWPMLGTPAWCTLTADDPRKLAALFDAAQHWALRVETVQQAKCAAAQAISESQTWREIANEIRQRSGIYIPRKSS